MHFLVLITSKSQDDTVWLFIVVVEETVEAAYSFHVVAAEAYPFHVVAVEAAYPFHVVAVEAAYPFHVVAVEAVYPFHVVAAVAFQLPGGEAEVAYHHVASFHRVEREVQRGHREGGYHSEVKDPLPQPMHVGY